MNFIKKILQKLNYEIELVSQLIIVIFIGAIYGFIESWYVPTDTMVLPLFGRWSYYHLFLLAIMFVASFALALNSIQWIISHRKKYILLMCLGSFPLSLMIEDLFWFVARWQPISRNEWTMIYPGLGINLYLTWVPLWYILTLLISGGLFYLASIYSTKGYNDYLEREHKCQF